MSKNNLVSLAVLLLVAPLTLALCPAPVLAQDAKSPDETKPDQSKSTVEGNAFQDHRYYHLDFNLREIGEDGKVINSRTYSIVVASDDKRNCSIRTGSRVPIYQNGSKSIYNYQDVGVNIDSRNVHLVHLAQDELSMQVEAEISSLATVPDANDVSAPVIRQNKWDSEVVLPLNKPTILFSSDNVSSKGKLQLELTASPIK